MAPGTAMVGVFLEGLGQRIFNWLGKVWLGKVYFRSQKITVIMY